LLGLRGPFFVYAVFLFVAALVALLVLRRPAVPNDAAGAVGRRGRGVPPADAAASAEDLPLRPSRGLVAALSAGFALWWLMGGFRFAVMPLYAQEHIGLDSGAIGLGLTASAVANVFMLWPAGLASDRFGRQAVGVPAFCGLGMAALALLRADTFTGFLLANAFVGAMYGCASTMPGTLLADSTPRSRAGVASGLAHLTNDLGNVLGPLAVGFTLDRAGFGAAIGLGVAPALVAAAVIASAPRKKRLAETT
jgi:MFS family permease